MVCIWVVDKLFCKFVNVGGLVTFIVEIFLSKRVG